MTAPPSLRLEGVSVGYRRRPVVKNFSVPPIEPGQVTALLGPNAAGKTTLLRGLAGLLPARGSVILGDRQLLGLSAADHSALVAYMPQTLPERVALTSLEATLSALKASPAGGISSEEARRRAYEALERLGIGSLALRALDELSGGQRQLASLAQAIVRDPTVLLLDEPTSALDLNHQMRVMSVVREAARSRGMIVLMVLHDIGLACRWADRVIVLSNGDVAADGSPEEAVTPDMLARVYEVAARVERCSCGTVQVLVDGRLGGPGDASPGRACRGTASVCSAERP